MHKLPSDEIQKRKRETLNNVNLIYSVEGKYGNYYTQHLWAALHFTQKPPPSHSNFQVTLRIYNTFSNDKEAGALSTQCLHCLQRTAEVRKKQYKIRLQNHFFRSCTAI